jgi:hypothetical protein
MVQVDRVVQVAEQLHSIIILQHHLRVLGHPDKDILVANPLRSILVAYKVPVQAVVAAVLARQVIINQRIQYLLCLLQHRQVVMV